MRAVYYAVFHPYKLVKDTRTGGCSVGVHVKQGEGVSSRAHAISYSGETGNQPLIIYLQASLVEVRLS
jgi:hypothetical protein